MNNKELVGFLPQGFERVSDFLVPFQMMGYLKKVRTRNGKLLMEKLEALDIFLQKDRVYHQRI